MANNSERIKNLSPEQRLLLDLMIAERRAQRSKLREITRRPNQTPCPLSYAQQRLWFFDQLHPANPAYNIPLALKLQGHLNTEALRASLQQVVHRHEALRTTFTLAGHQPLQIIHPSLHLHLPLLDLSTLPASDRSHQARLLAQTEARTGFDLRQGPLLRARLLRLEEQEHWLLLTMHHIVSDGWSMGVLLREIRELYGAGVRGEESRLAELPIQYADYAVWQREWLSAGGVAERQLSYWREQLRGVGERVTQIGGGGVRRAVQRYEGGREEVVIGAEVVEGLREVGRAGGATLFMVLLASFKVLVMRYSGEEEVVVGTPVANRNRVETEGLIGFFVNMLTLRTKVRRGWRFGQVLREVREVALGGYANQDVPFERVVEELAPERSLSHHPLFQVVFVLQGEVGELELEGLEVELEEVHDGTAKYEMLMTLREEGGEVRGVLEYNADLFDAAMIERMARNFEILLAGIAADPQLRLTDLPLLAPPERHRLLVEWNETAAELPAAKYLHHFFEEQTERTPQAVAVSCAGESISYWDLNCRANRLAHYLRAQGVGADACVGICAERSIEMVVGLLAILKAGAAYLPLNPEYPPERLAFMLEEAGSSVLLTQERLRAQLRQRPVAVFCLDSDWRMVAHQPTSNPAVEIAADNLAYVIYTSGSTGRPKGVMNTHGAIANRLLWMQQVYGLNDTDCVLQKTPTSFDVSVWELFWPLMTGARLEMALPGGHRDNAYLVKTIQERQVTTIHFVPSMLQAFLEEEGVSHCRSLRRIISSGETLDKQTAQRCLERLPHSELYNLYGPTEAAVDVTWWKCAAEDEERATIPIGRPIANTQLYILDEVGELVPVGVAGELYIGGAGLARGYLKQPAMTAERFIPDRYGREAGARLYRTGDTARYSNDGEIEHLGRTDYQVKLRGFRIEPGEIEATLLGQGLAQEALVIAREDTPGDQRLVAYIVPCPERAVTVPEVRACLREQLPEYMVPTAFVLLDALPLNAHGKVNRRALPVPDASQRELKPQYVAPRTHVEEYLCLTCEELLKVKRVGIHDNFFELGGHSLLAIQLLSRLRETFGGALPLSLIFNAPTVAGLAEQLTRLGDENQPVWQSPIERRPPPHDRAPLSYTQEGLFIFDQILPGTFFFNIHANVEIEGALDVALMERCFKELIKRHESLSTTFILSDDQPIQVIASDTDFSLPVVNLRDFPDEQGKAEELQRIIEWESRRPFDLSKGPLLRATLVRQQDNVSTLLLTIHHIVADAWSLRILFDELVTLYRAFSENRESPLPALPVQYADFAVWQRRWLESESAKRQIRYWKEQLGEPLDELQLPLDRPREEGLSLLTARQTCILSAELSASLRDFSQQEGCTLFMTLLAALNVLLYSYTEQAQFRIGTTVANRHRREVEGLIGLFLNTSVLRANLSGDPTLREAVRRARENALGVFANQEVPFEELIRQLEDEYEIDRASLFRVMFLLDDDRLSTHDVPKLKFRVPRTRSPHQDLTMTATTCDLLFSVRAQSRRVSVTVIYKSDLFDRLTIKRMLRRYRRLLSEMVSNPEQRVAEVRRRLNPGG